MAPKANKSAVPAHPKYSEMITAAIKALKERNGSSLYAISKYVGATYKLPAGWEKKVCGGAWQVERFRNAFHRASVA